MEEITLFRVSKEQLLGCNAARRVNVQLLSLGLPMVECRNDILIETIDDKHEVEWNGLICCLVHKKRFKVRIGQQHMNFCTYAPFKSPLAYPSLHMYPWNAFKAPILRSAFICHPMDAITSCWTFSAVLLFLRNTCISRVSVHRMAPTKKGVQ